MTSYVSDGTVGPWAKEKLECLGKYLSAYTTILRQQKWCKRYYFVDAFAGAGIAPLRKVAGEVPEIALFDTAEIEADADEIEYVKGSPRVALELKHPFTNYVFIELNSDRADELRRLVSEYELESNVEIRTGDAARELVDFIRNSESEWKRNARAVVFLDPFGMQVNWRVIAQLAETHAIEIFINFPVGTTIQRLLPTTGNLSEAQRAKLDDYFGTPDWFDLIYEQTTNLFGETVTEKANDTGARLAIWYRNRLKELFGYASLPRLIRNTQGGHLYYLIFAGPNKTGAKIANHVLGQGTVVR